MVLSACLMNRAEVIRGLGTCSVTLRTALILFDDIQTIHLQWSRCDAAVALTQHTTFSRTACPFSDCVVPSALAMRTGIWVA